MCDDDDKLRAIFVFALYWLRMKLYGFTNFVEQHLVPYEYASIDLVVIEASKWLLQRGILLYDGNK